MSSEPNLKRIFSIDIGENHLGEFIGVIKSVQEDKAMIIKAPNLRLMLVEINKHIKKRRNYLRKFPLPIRSPIMTIEESLVKPSRFILPSNGD